MAVKQILPYGDDHQTSFFFDIIKTAWPASWARFSSTEPNGRTPLLSYQTLEQTPQGKGDAEGTKESFLNHSFKMINRKGY